MVDVGRADAGEQAPAIFSVTAEGAAAKALSGGHSAVKISPRSSVEAAQQSGGELSYGFRAAGAGAFAGWA